MSFTGSGGGLNHSWFNLWDNTTGSTTTYFSLWVEIGGSNRCGGLTVPSILIILSSLLSLETLLIAAVIISKKKLQTVTNFLVFSCTFIAPAALSFSVMMNIVSVAVHWSIGVPACKYATFAIVSASHYIMWTLAAIAIDRHRQITTPNKAQLRVTSASIVSAIIAVKSVLVSLPYTALYDVVKIREDNPTLYICARPSSVIASVYAFILVLFSFFAPLALLGICYHRIIKQISETQAKLRMHSKRNNSVMYGQGSSMVRDQVQAITLTPVTTPPRAMLIQQEKRTRKYKRLVKVLVIIVILFIIMWLPLILLFALITLDERTESYRLRSYHILLGICGVVLNACITPVIYSLSDGNIKRTLFKRCLGHEDGDVVEDQKSTTQAY